MTIEPTLRACLCLSAPRFRRLPGLALLLCALSLAQSHATIDQHQVRVGDGTDIPVTVYAAEGNVIFLWIPSEHGVLPAHHALARALSDHGIESWITDTYSAYFLPTGPSGLHEIPTSAIADLIQAAAETAKTVFVVSHDRGAALSLLAIREWQTAHSGPTSLGGAVLISPYLVEGTPAVGQEARYRAIAAATNLPVYVVQPVHSPLYWRLPGLIRELERGGGSVFAQTLEGVRDRFFFRPDSRPEEDRLTERLPNLLATASRLLATQEPIRLAAPLIGSDQIRDPTGTARQLEPYAGDPQPPPLHLSDLERRRHDLSQYAGKVVLLNFWASWCPPCVHEMPSMQALNERMRNAPFGILAVNLGEEPEPVRGFLRTQGLDLPVLMDPEGTAIRDWRIFAFPTSYLIDKAGRIRYAVFGAIDWMDPEIIETVEALVSE